MSDEEYKRHLYYLIKDGEKDLEETQNGIDWLTASAAGKEAVRETDSHMVTGEFVLDKPMIGVHRLFLSDKLSLKILKELKLKVVEQLNLLQEAHDEFESSGEILLPQIKERTKHKPFTI